jgi:phage-related protein
VQYSGTFLDLAGKGEPEKRFCLGDTHRLVHSLLGIDETVRIVGLKRDLLRPWSVELTLGDIFYNAEQQRYRETQSLQSQINETYKHRGGNS